MSTRVMNIFPLEGFVPRVSEIYSIDEAFLDLDSLKKNYNLYDFGCHIRSIVKQWTGDSCSYRESDFSLIKH